MLGSRKFEKTIFRLILAAVIFSLIIACFPNIFGWIAKDNADADYSTIIFGHSIINIDITADENDWNEMLENKMSKPYISCDLKIDGQEFKNVGLRPKGNSSLTSIQGDRISYRLDFDHYVDNQNCYGLEQMVLNNLQADATYMKDYVAYDLMAYQGVNAPLHTHAFITINGKPFGVYLAVEVYDEDYLTRVYGDTNVKLYSVKSSGLDAFESALIDSETCEVIESEGMKETMDMGMGGPPPEMGEQGGPGMPPPPQMNGQGQPQQGGMPPQMGQPPQEQMPMGNNEQHSGKGDNQSEVMPTAPGGEGGGGDLVYTDDYTNSYSTIFANAVSKRTDASDYAKVIRAIKYLNKENVTNEELEQYWDIEAALRYLAVHTFMVNGDSYTGNMKQNYYLAERNGKVTVLPWDYNLSFGAFGGGPGGGGLGGSPMDMSNTDGVVQAPEQRGMRAENAQTIEVINHAIDTPTIDVDMDSRPLVAVLLGRDEYKQKYHQYLDELTQYANSEFINKLEYVENAIYPYVEQETVSFYTHEEHQNAFEVLKSFLKLRCESIQGQLSGEIPSTTSEQEGAVLITANFSIDEMGTMGGAQSGAPPDMSGGNEMVQPPGNQSVGDVAERPQPLVMPGGNDENGMVQPPGMQQSHNNTYAITIVALVILCILSVGVKLFKRNY